MLLSLVRLVTTQAVFLLARLPQRSARMLPAFMTRPDSSSYPFFPLWNEQQDSTTRRMNAFTSVFCRIIVVRDRVLSAGAC